MAQRPDASKQSRWLDLVQRWLRSHAALAHLDQLYAVESEARERIAEGKLEGLVADAVRLALRQTKSLPLLATLKAWLEAERPKVLPKSTMGLTVAYARRHGAVLERYATDGFLAIDNNVAERTLRHGAIGRKNWLLAGSAAGARTAATLFSVASSCRRHEIDVFAYLQDVLTRLVHEPNPPPERLRAWLPDRWQPPPRPHARYATARRRRPRPHVFTGRIKST
jgi:transposase